ncbi:hypothetical protein [Microlunatus antarcticus]|uniref:PknH-like extracellular domain-containing protein n=1 Tax=Microlunatus antarcticus TaxID=53388 RepID=A0A7W5P8A4_9ACTN|nr:hypothetical protein [Microlunatus antarcticus]MBB3328355.1 hypothetical protein [Microlunatus antarcticus]
MVAAALVVSLVLLGAEVGAALGVRAALDRRAFVSDLRLDAALETFRPVDRSGLASPADPAGFGPDRSPRTDPAACAPLTVLTSTPPLDGRSWTGINGRPAQPVTLLVVRFADADAARAELDRKRVAMLRCTRVAVTFPPYDRPPTAYEVTGRHWLSSAAGSVVRWSLVDGDRRFDFYVQRYANTLTWTYADDVSTPPVREQVARSLVVRLRDLEHQ